MLGFLCVFCTVAAAAASMQIYEMCPGTSFYIPPSPEYDPKTSDLYFTPGSGPRKNMVLNRTQPTSNHYQYQQETLFISELRDGDTGVFSWSDNGEFNTVLKLVIKDCSVPRVVVFGNPLELDVPSEATKLEFSPASPPKSKNVVLSLYGSTWSLESTSHAHSGFYTFRKKNGAEISKINVIVTADMKFYNIDEEKGSGDLEIKFPIRQDDVSLSITTRSGERFEVIADGYITRPGKSFFGDRMRIFDTGGIVELGDVDEVGAEMHLSVEESDAGRYEFRDKQDRVIAVWILTTNDTLPYYVYVVYALIPIAALILLCVCVKKCCCKKTKSNSRPAAETAATDNTPYRPVEMNDLEPANSSAPPVDTGRVEPTPSGPSAPPAPSALDFSSTDQPQFQLRGFGSDMGNFLTSPLGMDTGATNGDPSVYTSSKLN